MKYVEAEIDGKWVVVDEVKATEYNTFIIYDENGNGISKLRTMRQMRKSKKPHINLRLKVLTGAIGR